ncbi:MAG: D-aminoacylase [Deltaproteobacteria bacterium]|nr:D-aminoacylase [Deltaproteobacteria bacterium]
MAEPFDLVICNARIVDGTGNPYYLAHIALNQGRIVKIGRNIDPKGAGKIIDADGMIACPGFLDTHSHDDVYLLARPDCDDKVLQGVTTEVIGNCGLSLAPVSEEHHADLRNIARIIGGDHLPEHVWRIRSFADYLTELERLKPGINVVPLVGHGTIRIAVMGMEQRDPTEAELKEMKILTTKAMEEGAFGLSTGLIYVPANYAKTDEIIELARIVGQYHGLYTTHIRSEGDDVMQAMDEALSIGQAGEVPVVISHHKVMGRNNWGRSVETLQKLEEARARGQEVVCDQYPYTAGSTYLAALLPPSIQAGGYKAYSEKLKDPDLRGGVVNQIENDDGAQWENMIKAAGFEGVVISIAQNHREYIGKSIAEIAKLEGKNPYDVIFDLLIEEGEGVGVILHFMDEQDVQRILKSPLAMVGSDGFPDFGESKVHPRQTGTFPRILSRYVREKGLIRLEEAIRKMTSLPAQTFRLKKKGLLKEGLDADIVIFDPDTVLDKATFDDPRQKPEGIVWVLINGEVAVEEGRITGEATGKVLRYCTDK